MSFTCFKSQDSNLDSASGSGGSTGTFCQQPIFHHRSSRVICTKDTSRPGYIPTQAAFWNFHLRSIWLFTFSDLKTIVGPKTVFGVMNALSAPTFGIGTALEPTWLLRRAVLVALWIWINLLPFAIDNQRQPEAIAEDSLNKPWRPMPSKRLTQRQARQIMFTLYPLAGVTSLYTGGFRQSITLMVLGCWYNDYGGADTSCIIRNFINACGFVCYSSGAMEVALGYTLPWHAPLVRWFFIIGAVVFSTVQTQDLYDQAGDKLRGRKTVPLVAGDETARWITVIPIIVWSIFCPSYWNPHWGFGVAFTLLGYLIVLRCLTKRSVSDDKKTFRLWNLWMAFMYSLPLLKSTYS